MKLSIGVFAIGAFTAGLLGGCGMIAGFRGNTGTDADRPATEAASPALIAEGLRVFRFDTFGDEQVWTDTLGLHEVIEKSVDPLTALKVGLKVDADRAATWDPRQG